MARIRTIKPDFWTSAQVTECSLTARLLFIGIWNFCDDAGRMEDNPRQIKMKVFPGDDISTESIHGMLTELETNGLIKRYSVDGQGYFYVTGWHHQVINRPQKPRCPTPISDHSVSDHVPLTPERKGKEGKGSSERVNDHDAAMLLLNRLNEILGIDPAKQINPNWHKTQIQLCREWIALGRQPDQITAIVSAVAERQRGADPTWRASTLRYFDAAVRRDETPKPPDPLKGWKPKTCTDEELELYRQTAPIAAARQIPDSLWREPRGRDWTLRLESFSKSKTKRWPDAWGDPPWECDNPLAAELLLHFPDVRPA